MDYILISGSFPLQLLYDYAIINPDIPQQSESKFREFEYRYERLIYSVPRIPGWYFWINNENQNITPIYVGKSFQGNTSNLKARLKETFYDEFVAIWATLYDPDRMVERLRQKNISFGNKDYLKEIRRSAKKRGASHIIWVGKEDSDMQENLAVEKFLIYKIQPTANVQGKKTPVPENDLNISIYNKYLEECQKLI